MALKTWRTITISGVPEGVTLSAGSETSPGVWTVSSNDISGLSITTPTDQESFDLTVSTNSIDTDADDDATDTSDAVEQTITINVADAIAGDDSIVGGAGNDEIHGNAGDDILIGDGVEEGGSGSITAANATDTDTGFTVTGRVVNADGTLSDASADNLSFGNSTDGPAFGAKGAQDGGPAMLSWVMMLEMVCLNRLLLILTTLPTPQP